MKVDVVDSNNRKVQKSELDDAALERRARELNRQYFGGKLPGDIRIQGQSGTVFIPITSMIVISVVLSVGLNLLLRFLRWLG